MLNRIVLHDSWKLLLQNEFQKPYFSDLSLFLKSEIESGQTIYPSALNTFTSLNKTPFEHVKVVLLGQDPYHGIGQANGLSFSVNQGVNLPPSLRNIFNELKSDLTVCQRNNGDLSDWAKQGVLLLNSVLSVRAQQPASHKNKGWEVLTDHIISTLSNQKNNLVFLLWGNFAKSKKLLIDSNKHLILETSHPSPFSAHKGFLGCGHFSKTNAYLKQHGFKKIEWNRAI